MPGSRKTGSISLSVNVWPDPEREPLRPGREKERFYRRRLQHFLSDTPYLVNTMDEIEKGFEKLKEKMDTFAELQEKGKTLSEKVRTNDAKLLEKMAKTAEPVVKRIGINILKKGKQDTKGEMYDPQYYIEKMIILGKTDPAPCRPDNPSVPVVDQFCVLSEEGSLFEVMYSFDGFLTDSYLQPITSRQAIDQYGYDIMFMLYAALRDYLAGEEELVAALEKVIGYVFVPKK